MKTNWPAIRVGCLMLGSAGLTTGPILAQTPEPASASATASVISSVAITQAPQHTTVRVEGEGRLQVRAARMQNPDRLVLDFTGARLAVPKTVIPGVSAPVRGVRLGQFRPDVARVVIDLSVASPYQISREGQTVVIAFDATAQPSADALARAVKMASESSRYQMASPRSAALHANKPLRIRAPRFALPGELTQPSFVLASFGGSNEPARPAQVLAAQQAAQQQAGSAASTVANAPQSTQASPTSGSKYTGEPISVNLKDVDLKDFFRLIHEISGLNVVLDPAVHGSLTIVLDEVPWDQALDIVLQNNGLDKQLSGNVRRRKR
jgi:AMIN domain